METNTIDLRQEILTNELGDEMLDMISPIYDRSKVTLYLFQAIGIVLQKETDFIAKDFIDQMFIQTATWGLKYWEEEYGITPDPSFNVKQRRQNIISALQYKAPITPKKIEDRISAMVGLPVEIKENISPNTIEAFVVGYVSDTKKIEELLDKIIPAHLKYTINANDYENSKLSEYYKVLVSECDTSTVVFNNP